MISIFLLIASFTCACCSYQRAFPVVHHILQNHHNEITSFYKILEENNSQQLIHAPQAFRLKIRIFDEGQKGFLLVKTLRHRDKRYISYLTLCHFKICNMGRKRTSRYFQAITGNK